MNAFKLLTIALVVLASSASYGFSCAKPQPASEQEIRRFIANQKYAPLTGTMLLTSAVGNLMASLSMAIPKDKNGESKTSFETDLSLGISSAVLLLSFYTHGGCGNYISNLDSVDPSTVTISDGDRDGWHRKSNFVFWMHLMGLIPPVFIHAKSEKKNKDSILAGAVFAPVVAELLVRNIFYREHASPWTFQPGFVMNNEYVPGIGVAYEF